MDEEGKYTTRNRVPLKPFKEKEKEQESFNPFKMVPKSIFHLI